jgi:hypothetical protein
LDTLAELAHALGDDSNFAVSVNTALSNRYTKQESDERYVKVDDLGGGSSDYENLVGKVGEIESQIGDISTILTALHEGGI